MLASDTPEAVAQNIVQNSLSVRDTETLVKKPENTADKVEKIAKAVGAVKDVDTLNLEKTLTDALGLKVLIEDKGTKGGSVKIAYSTLEQLDDICRRIKTS